MPTVQRDPSHETNRRTAYAAVTASMEGNGALVADIVYELIQQPEDAAQALLALIQACAATTELWARSIAAEPRENWRAFAQAVTVEVGQAPHTCDHDQDGT